MRGTADQRWQLLARELFMPALSSLQPAVAVCGSHSGGSSAGKASGGGASAGGGSGGFCLSPAVSELEVDRLSLRASGSWADLTLVETKTSSKGTSAAIPQLKRSAMVLLCGYHVIRQRSATLWHQLPVDVKARGVVAWARVEGNPPQEPVKLRPACGPAQVLDVDVFSAQDVLQTSRRRVLHRWHGDRMTSFGSEECCV
ncbi:hypothetical protein CHLRE_11g467732v5 [Chlamydomonas reinhardtii]|uniref:Uncharacterized protein n=1 Tax=Chlamydomonas reinhardtii TaxID=3055 RepID=A0A2K3D7V2_CHLRE|nr:uncharacterized protein CHLRE_11g467732v5 [Chlamydomonas reinhardtii]PNW76611.1 hypothetical protein CHLRE_11g467732v5 [Chlamydomonas reinhardtii]